MPEYSYKCQNCGTVTDERHPAGTTPLITCPNCGHSAARMYTVPRINWGGLRPSQGEYSRHFKELFANEQENREAYKERKHEHEIRQAAAEANATAPNPARGNG